MNWNKYKSTLFFMLLLPLLGSAQVKVGTNPMTIDSSAAFEIESTTQGLLPPRMTSAQMNAISNPAIGLMVYCLDCDPKGLYLFNENEWVSIFTGPPVSIGIDCEVNGFSGTLTGGEAVAGQTYSLTVTNNSFTEAMLNFSTSDISFSGVSGVTVASVSPPSATLSGAGASQLVSYTLGGTPASGGSLTATVNIANLLDCSASTTINEGSTNGTAVIDGFGTGAGCTEAAFSANMTEGVDATGTTLTIYANVSQVGTYSISATANGVTFSASGTFASTGCQAIVLTASGTPADGGSFTWTTNTTPSESATTDVIFSIPATITLGQDQDYFVASIYDQDYLPYTAPTGPAVTTAVAADGSNEATTIDVQGSITTGGVTVGIPVTATGSGTLSAYSSTITIDASLTEDGISRDLTLSWASQAYTSSTTSISATLTAVGGDLNAKKLDLNGGIGNDNLGVLMGSFSYIYNAAYDITSFEVRIISGIPDRAFGDGVHDFIYLTVVGEDGNTWLNNNLGAHYADVHHANFNPTQQATAFNDHLAYGSLYQWGRLTDGHELITWTGASAGTAVNGTTSTNATTDTPANALFITESGSPYDWRVPQNNNLWQGVSGTNNPCPVGYRLPTEAEQNQLVTDASITNTSNAASSNLAFSAAGYRNNSTGAISNAGSYGDYWSSTVSGTNARTRLFGSSITNVSGDLRARGFSVRCIKD